MRELITEFAQNRMEARDARGAEGVESAHVTVLMQDRGYTSAEVQQFEAMLWQASRMGTNARGTDVATVEALAPIARNIVQARNALASGGSGGGIVTGGVSTIEAEQAWGGFIAGSLTGQGLDNLTPQQSLALDIANLMSEQGADISSADILFTAAANGYDANQAGEIAAVMGALMNPVTVDSSWQGTVIDATLGMVLGLGTTQTTGDSGLAGALFAGAIANQMGPMDWLAASPVSQGSLINFGDVMDAVPAAVSAEALFSAAGVNAIGIEGIWQDAFNAAIPFVQQNLGIELVQGNNLFESTVQTLVAGIASGSFRLDSCAFSAADALISGSSVQGLTSEDIAAGILTDVLTGQLSVNEITAQDFSASNSNGVLLSGQAILNMAGSSGVGLQAYNAGGMTATEMFQTIEAANGALGVNTPVIAHLDIMDGHFVVIEDIENGTVTYARGTFDAQGVRETGTMSAATFNSLSSGNFITDLDFTDLSTAGVGFEMPIGVEVVGAGSFVGRTAGLDLGVVEAVEQAFNAPVLGTATVGGMGGGVEVFNFGSWAQSQDDSVRSALSNLDLFTAGRISNRLSERGESAEVVADFIHALEDFVDAYDVEGGTAAIPMGAIVQMAMDSGLIQYGGGALSVDDAVSIGASMIINENVQLQTLHPAIIELALHDALIQGQVFVQALVGTTVNPQLAERARQLGDQSLGASFEGLMQAVQQINDLIESAGTVSVEDLNKIAQQTGVSLEVVAGIAAISNAEAAGQIVNASVVATAIGALGQLEAAGIEVRGLTVDNIVERLNNQSGGVVSVAGPGVVQPVISAPAQAQPVSTTQTTGQQSQPVTQTRTTGTQSQAVRTEQSTTTQAIVPASLESHILGIQGVLRQQGMLGANGMLDLSALDLQDAATVNSVVDVILDALLDTTGGQVNLSVYELAQIVALLGGNQAVAESLIGVIQGELFETQSSDITRILAQADAVLRAAASSTDLEDSLSVTLAESVLSSGLLSSGAEVDDLEYLAEQVYGRDVRGDAFDRGLNALDQFMQQELGELYSSANIALVAAQVRDLEMPQVDLVSFEPTLASVVTEAEVTEQKPAQSATPTSTSTLERGSTLNTSTIAEVYEDMMTPIVSDALNQVGLQGVDELGTETQTFAVSEITEVQTRDGRKAQPGQVADWSEVATVTLSSGETVTWNEVTNVSLNRSGGANSALTQLLNQVGIAGISTLSTGTTTIKTGKVNQVVLTSGTTMAIQEFVAGEQCDWAQVQAVVHIVGDAKWGDIAKVIDRNGQEMAVAAVTDWSTVATVVTAKGESISSSQWSVEEGKKVTALDTLILADVSSFSQSQNARYGVRGQTANMVRAARGQSYTISYVNSDGEQVTENLSFEDLVQAVRAVDLVTDDVQWNNNAGGYDHLGFRLREGLPADSRRAAVAAAMAQIVDPIMKALGVARVGGHSANVTTSQARTLINALKNPKLALELPTAFGKSYMGVHLLAVAGQLTGVDKSFIMFANRLKLDEAFGSGEFKDDGSRNTMYENINAIYAQLGFKVARVLSLNDLQDPALLQEVEDADIVATVFETAGFGVISQENGYAERRFMELMRDHEEPDGSQYRAAIVTDEMQLVLSMNFIHSVGDEMEPEEASRLALMETLLGFFQTETDTLLAHVFAGELSDKGIESEALEAFDNAVAASGGQAWASVQALTNAFKQDGRLVGRLLNEYMLEKLARIPNVDSAAIQRLQNLAKAVHQVDSVAYEVNTAKGALETAERDFQRAVFVGDTASQARLEQQIAQLQVKLADVEARLTEAETQLTEMLPGLQVMESLTQVMRAVHGTKGTPEGIHWLGTEESAATDAVAMALNFWAENAPQARLTRFANDGKAAYIDLRSVLIDEARDGSKEKISALFSDEIFALLAHHLASQAVEDFQNMREAERAQAAASDKFFRMVADEMHNGGLAVFADLSPEAQSSLCTEMERQLREDKADTASRFNLREMIGGVAQWYDTAYEGGSYGVRINGEKSAYEVAEGVVSDGNVVFQVIPYSQGVPSPSQKMSSWAQILPATFLGLARLAGRDFETNEVRDLKDQPEVRRITGGITLDQLATAVAEARTNPESKTGTFTEFLAGAGVVWSTTATQRFGSKQLLSGLDSVEFSSTMLLGNKYLRGNESGVRALTGRLELGEEVTQDLLDNRGQYYNEESVLMRLRDEDVRGFGDLTESVQRSLARMEEQALSNMIFVAEGQGFHYPDLAVLTEAQLAAYNRGHAADAIDLAIHAGDRWLVKEWDAATQSFGDWQENDFSTDIKNRYNGQTTGRRTWSIYSRADVAGVSIEGNADLWNQRYNAMRATLLEDISLTTAYQFDADHSFMDALQRDLTLVGGRTVALDALMNLAAGHNMASDEVLYLAERYMLGYRGEELRGSQFRLSAKDAEALASSALEAIAKAMAENDSVDLSAAHAIEVAVAMFRDGKEPANDVDRKLFNQLQDTLANSIDLQLMARDARRDAQGVIAFDKAGQAGWVGLVETGFTVASNEKTELSDWLQGLGRASRLKNPEWLEAHFVGSEYAGRGQGLTLGEVWDTVSKNEMTAIREERLSGVNEALTALQVGMIKEAMGQIMEGYVQQVLAEVGAEWADLDAHQRGILLSEADKRAQQDGDYLALDRERMAIWNSQGRSADNTGGAGSTVAEKLERDLIEAQTRMLGWRYAGQNNDAGLLELDIDLSQGTPQIQNAAGELYESLSPQGRAIFDGLFDRYVVTVNENGTQFSPEIQWRSGPDTRNWALDFTADERCVFAPAGKPFTLADFAQGVSSFRRSDLPTFSKSSTLAAANLVQERRTKVEQKLQSVNASDSLAVTRDQVQELLATQQSARESNGEIEGLKIHNASDLADEVSVYLSANGHTEGEDSLKVSGQTFFHLMNHVTQLDNGVFNRLAAMTANNAAAALEQQSAELMLRAAEGQAFVDYAQRAAADAAQMRSNAERYALGQYAEGEVAMVTVQVARALVDEKVVSLGMPYGTHNLDNVELQLGAVDFFGEAILGSLNLQDLAGLTVTGDPTHRLDTLAGVLERTGSPLAEPAAVIVRNRQELNAAQRQLDGAQAEFDQAEAMRARLQEQSASRSLLQRGADAVRSLLEEQESTTDLRAAEEAETKAQKKLDEAQARYDAAETGARLTVDAVAGIARALAEDADSAGRIRQLHVQGAPDDDDDPEVLVNTVQGLLYNFALPQVSSENRNQAIENVQTTLAAMEELTGMDREALSIDELHGLASAQDRQRWQAVVDNATDEKSVVVIAAQALIDTLEEGQDSTNNRSEILRLLDGDFPDLNEGQRAQLLLGLTDTEADLARFRSDQSLKDLKTYHEVLGVAAMTPEEFAQWQVRNQRNQREQMGAQAQTQQDFLRPKLAALSQAMPDNPFVSSIQNAMDTVEVLGSVLDTAGLNAEARRVQVLRNLIQGIQQSLPGLVLGTETMLSLGQVSGQLIAEGADSTEAQSQIQSLWIQTLVDLMSDQSEESLSQPRPQIPAHLLQMLGGQMPGLGDDETQASALPLEVAQQALTQIQSGESVQEVMNVLSGDLSEEASDALQDFLAFAQSMSFTTENEGVTTTYMGGQVVNLVSAGSQTRVQATNAFNDPWSYTRTEIDGMMRTVVDGQVQSLEFNGAVVNNVEYAQNGQVAAYQVSVRVSPEVTLIQRLTPVQPTNDPGADLQRQMEQALNTLKEVGGVDPENVSWIPAVVGPKLSEALETVNLLAPIIYTERIHRESILSQIPVSALDLVLAHGTDEARGTAQSLSDSLNLPALQDLAGALTRQIEQPAALESAGSEAPADEVTAAVQAEPEGLKLDTRAIIALAHTPRGLAVEAQALARQLLQSGNVDQALDLLHSLASQTEMGEAAQIASVILSAMYAGYQWTPWFEVPEGREQRPLSELFEGSYARSSYALQAGAPVSLSVRGQEGTNLMQQVLVTTNSLRLWSERHQEPEAQAEVLSHLIRMLQDIQAGVTALELGLGQFPNADRDIVLASYEVLQDEIQSTISNVVGSMFRSSNVQNVSVLANALEAEGVVADNVAQALSALPRFQGYNGLPNAAAQIRTEIDLWLALAGMDILADAPAIMGPLAIEQVVTPQNDLRIYEDGRIVSVENANSVAIEIDYGLGGVEQYRVHGPDGMDRQFVSRDGTLDFAAQMAGALQILSSDNVAVEQATAAIQDLEALSSFSRIPVPVNEISLTALQTLAGSESSMAAVAESYLSNRRSAVLQGLGFGALPAPAELADALLSITGTDAVPEAQGVNGLISQINEGIRLRRAGDPEDLQAFNTVLLQRVAETQALFENVAQSALTPGIQYLSQLVAAGLSLELVWDVFRNTEDAASLQARFRSHYANRNLAGEVANGEPIVVLGGDQTRAYTGQPVLDMRITLNSLNNRPFGEDAPPELHASALMAMGRLLADVNVGLRTLSASDPQDRDLDTQYQIVAYEVFANQVSETIAQNVYALMEQARATSGSAVWWAMAEAMQRDENYSEAEAVVGALSSVFGGRAMNMFTQHMTEMGEPYEAGSEELGPVLDFVGLMGAYASLMDDVAGVDLRPESFTQTRTEEPAAEAAAEEDALSRALRRLINQSSGALGDATGLWSVLNGALPFMRQNNQVLTPEAAAAVVGRTQLDLGVLERDLDAIQSQLAGSAMSPEIRARWQEALGQLERAARRASAPEIRITSQEIQIGGQLFTQPTDPQLLTPVQVVREQSQASDWIEVVRNVDRDAEIEEAVRDFGYALYDAFTNRQSSTTQNEQYWNTMRALTAVAFGVSPQQAQGMINEAQVHLGGDHLMGFLHRLNLALVEYGFVVGWPSAGYLAGRYARVDRYRVVEPLRLRFNGDRPALEVMTSTTEDARRWFGTDEGIGGVADGLVAAINGNYFGESATLAERSLAAPAADSGWEWTADQLTALAPLVNSIEGMDQEHRRQFYLQLVRQEELLHLVDMQALNAIAPQNVLMSQDFSLEQQIDAVFGPVRNTPFGQLFGQVLQHQIRIIPDQTRVSGPYIAGEVLEGHANVAQLLSAQSNEELAVVLGHLFREANFVQAAHYRHTTQVLLQLLVELMDGDIRYVSEDSAVDASLGALEPGLISRLVSAAQSGELLNLIQRLRGQDARVEIPAAPFDMPTTPVVAAAVEFQMPADTSRIQRLEEVIEMVSGENWSVPVTDRVFDRKMEQAIANLSRFLESQKPGQWNDRIAAQLQGLWRELAGLVDAGDLADTYLSPQQAQDRTDMFLQKLNLLLAPKGWLVGYGAQKSAMGQPLRSSRVQQYQVSAELGRDGTPLLITLTKEREERNWYPPSMLAFCDPISHIVSYSGALAPSASQPSPIRGLMDAARGSGLTWSAQQEAALAPMQGLETLSPEEGLEFQWRLAVAEELIHLVDSKAVNEANLKIRGVPFLTNPAVGRREQVQARFGADANLPVVVAYGEFLQKQLSVLGDKTPGDKIYLWELLHEASADMQQLLMVESPQELNAMVTARLREANFSEDYKGIYRVVGVAMVHFLAGLVSGNLDALIAGPVLPTKVQELSPEVISTVARSLASGQLFDLIRQLRGEEILPDLYVSPDAAGVRSTQDFEAAARGAEAAGTSA
ncbi:MAG: hypothetical protein JW937_08545 [Candidatus Omnitrophica bacterium]|nr:hypothetical protein [Candidatus Omnitrophota bacterium]